MSLQSMFNQMIGTIGVETSVLKNRLDKTAAPDKAEGPQKAVKGTEASKTTNDTVAEPERQEGPTEGPTKQINKGGRPKKEISIQRYQQAVNTMRNQKDALQARIAGLRTYAGMEEMR